MFYRYAFCDILELISPIPIQANGSFVSSVSPSASRRCCGLSTIKPSVFLWPTKLLLATGLNFLALVIK